MELIRTTPTPSSVTSASVSLRWAEEFLEQLVNIDSVSLNGAGVEQVQRKVAAPLSELGFRIHWQTRSDLPYGPFLKAELPGSSGRYITLVSHADTVLNPQPFHRLDTETATGSGVIDNKGGLTVLLVGLKLFLQTQPKLKYGLRVMSSPNEEVGSIGFLDTLRSGATDSVMGLGFEPALENGSIIQARRGNRWYQVRVQGREAHAGRSYGEHVNAAHELASQIHQMQKLTNYKKHISVNVGALSGGRDKFNVVCGFAEAKIDTRFADFKSRNRLHRKIEKILGKTRQVSVCGRFQSETTWNIVDDCPPFGTNRASKRLVKLYLDAVSQVEKRVILAESGGGAGDVNYISSENIAILDGLGPVGGQMHTLDEYIHLPSLWSRGWALSQFLTQVMQTP